MKYSKIRKIDDKEIALLHYTQTRGLHIQTSIIFILYIVEHFTTKISSYLKDFERSPDVALLALAANSGLGRFNSTNVGYFILIRLLKIKANP